jgi:hypothetical protein
MPGSDISRLISLVCCVVNFGLRPPAHPLNVRQTRIWGIQPIFSSLSIRLQPIATHSRCNTPAPYLWHVLVPSANICLTSSWLHSLRSYSKLGEVVQVHRGRRSHSPAMPKIARRCPEEITKNLAVTRAELCSCANRYQPVPDAESLPLNRRRRLA